MNKSLLGLEFQVDFEDGVSWVDVKVVMDESESFYELEMKDSLTRKPLPQEMFLEDPDSEPEKIYTRKDLERVMGNLFEIEPSDFEIQGVAEWETGVEIEALKIGSQSKAGQLLALVFDEIKAGVICDNIIETNNKLYIRYGEVILEVSPKFVIDPD